MEITAAESQIKAYMRHHLRENGDTNFSTGSYNGPATKPTLDLVEWVKARGLRFWDTGYEVNWHAPHEHEGEKRPHWYKEVGLEDLVVGPGYLANLTLLKYIGEEKWFASQNEVNDFILDPQRNPPLKN